MTPQPGISIESLNQLPAGEYYVPALLNVYTQVRRKDGHCDLVHKSQWEGQQWNRSPGNLVSEVQKVRLDPATGFYVKLSLTRIATPVEVPPDTEWVKRVSFRAGCFPSSGATVYLGATLLCEGVTIRTRAGNIRRYTIQDISDCVPLLALRLSRRPLLKARSSVGHG
ncbi:MAG: hypothetical protein IPM55_11840 [Acidobacteria bacterium]|nr:hypothetical protein [Acidobacteriota bacterium]